MARSNQLMMPLLIGGAAAIAVYLYTQQSGGTPAPLSIYPEYAYTAQTSMAATPSQQASTKPVTPMALYAATQAQEQAALYTQCAGSYPSCTILLSDTQLGF